MSQAAASPSPLPPPPAQTACGGALTDPTGYPSATYQGQTVYFCLHACRVLFERDPDRFMAGHIPHPLEETPEP